MKVILLFFTITLVNTLASGQTIYGFKRFDDYKLKPWLPDHIEEYQYLYYFGFSKSQSSLILIIDSKSCYAQIKYGEWVKKDKKRDWDWHYITLKNVRIQGNKIFTKAKLYFTTELFIFGKINNKNGNRRINRRF